MSEKSLAFSRFIALRYVSAGKQSHLVSFMSAISIFGLALGIAILITVLSVMNGFDREMRENILGIVPHITITSEENLGVAAWDEVAGMVGQHPDVLASAPVIEIGGVVATGQGNKAVLVNGIDPAHESEVSDLHRFLREGSVDGLAQTRWGIVLGAPLAERLGVGLGASVDLFSTSVNLNPITPLATFRQFTVVGIFKVGTEELDNELVLINIDAARALFRLRTPHNGLRLRTTDVLEADRIRYELAAGLPSTVATQSWTARFGAIYDNIRFSRGVIGFMLWLLVGVAAFNLVVSLIMIVRDKRGDIAILRTLGASPLVIKRIFMWQGCFIGLAGIAIGVSLGVLGSLQVSNFAAWIERRFALNLLNAEVYPIDFLPSQLSLVDVVTVAGGVLLLALLATLYPANRAAAVQPAEALRAD
ncbi:MAG TPA: lipoprotein-releasing ABC transporter permease subunit [Gammaproteobacteria bacterium]|nr:lipoprotein-releasing ABC transporter permease subunit [Gammaproteobacteria bacterium]